MQASYIMLFVFDMYKSACGFSINHHHKTYRIYDMEEYIDGLVLKRVF